jgi:hypothetical protein
MCLQLIRFFYKHFFLLVISVIVLFSCGQNNMSSKKNFTEIDFYSSGNWIFIKLKLNNTDSLNFILDSGVDETILNKRTARLLKYKFDKKASFSGAFEDDSVFYSENNTVLVTSNLIV